MVFDDFVKDLMENLMEFEYNDNCEYIEWV